MKKTIFLKQIIAILVIWLILLIINVGEVRGVLQSNRETQYTKTDNPINWITNFRKMETIGESMALNETLNTDLTASSESNNIDVHMMRTTEYGAIAILAASGYGNPSKVVTTTTGNNTGMIVNIASYEYTAGGSESLINTNGISKIYFDIYGNNTSAKVGDALGKATDKNPGCFGWHGTGANNMWPDSAYTNFRRGAGGLFAYGSGGYNGGFGYANFGRGVAVCGSGL